MYIKISQQKYVCQVIFINYCVFVEDLDHNISVILHYFLITFLVRLAAFADQTELSAILPIVKSCNVKPPVADPLCNVNTAATESYPR